MSRRYHRFVGGRVEARRAESLPWPPYVPDPRAPVTGPASVPAPCCPDVPPWERCEHQQMRKVLREMQR